MVRGNVSILRYLSEMYIYNLWPSANQFSQLGLRAAQKSSDKEVKLFVTRNRCLWSLNEWNDTLQLDYTSNIADSSTAQPCYSYFRETPLIHLFSYSFLYTMYLWECGSRDLSPHRRHVRLANKGAMRPITRCASHRASKYFNSPVCTCHFRRWLSDITNKCINILHILMRALACAERNYGGGDIIAKQDANPRLSRRFCRGILCKNKAEKICVCVYI